MQEWCCEGCGLSGTKTIKRGVDAYAGLQMVMGAHNKKSPTCPAPHLIRVRNKAVRGNWSQTKREARLAALKRKFIVEV